MRATFLFIVLSFMTQQCAPPIHPLVIGHRGARGHVAENTLPSIKKAIELGVDGIEIDVFRCASGELVVFHDRTLDRLTDAKGPIENLTLDTIRKIDVLEGYSIPTLDEVLDLIAGQVFLNIELKGSNTAILTDSLLKTKFEKGIWNSDKIIISSFNWKELEIFYKVNKQVPIAILTNDDPFDALHIAQQVAASAINPNYKTLTAENVSKIQKEGYKIYPWTVNEKEAINAMIAFGVEGIITDFPERVGTSK